MSRQPTLRSGRSARDVWKDMGLTEDIKIDLSSLMRKVKRLSSHSIPPEEAEQIEAAIELANPEAGFANQQVRVVDLHLWSLGVSNAPSAATRDEVQRRKEEADKRAADKRAQDAALQAQKLAREASRAAYNAAVASPAEKVQQGIDRREIATFMHGFCSTLFTVLLVGAILAAWVYWLFWPIWWLAKGRFEVTAGWTAAKCTIVQQRCIVKCSGDGCDSCDNNNCRTKNCRTDEMFLSDACVWLDKNKFTRDAQGTIVRSQLEGEGGLRGRAAELQSSGDAGSNLTYIGHLDQRRYGACHKAFQIRVAFRVGSACAAGDASCLGVPPSRALFLCALPLLFSNRKSARAQAHKTHVTTRMYACMRIRADVYVYAYTCRERMRARDE